VLSTTQAQHTILYSKFDANPPEAEKPMDGRLQQSIEALIYTENLSQ